MVRTAVSARPHVDYFMIVDLGSNDDSGTFVWSSGSPPIALTLSDHFSIIMLVKTRIGSERIFPILLI